MPQKQLKLIWRHRRPLVVGVAMALVTILALLAVSEPSKAPHPAQHQVFPASPELHASDFPAGDYAASMRENPVDPCYVVSLPSIRNALRVENLKVTSAREPSNSKTSSERSCVYGDHGFTVEVSTEQPRSYVIFNNAARRFTGDLGYVNRIIAITPEELDGLAGVRYGVWLFHNQQPAGAVFRLHTTMTRNGQAVGPNVTFYTTSPELTKQALTRLLAEAGSGKVK